MSALVSNPEPALQPPAPRGWNRPVRPLALVLVGGGVLLVWLVLMAVSVWYFYEHWEARVALRDQRLALRLPDGMSAVAMVTSPLRSRLNVQPLVHIPIKQTLTATLPDQLEAHVQLHTVLPVDTSVTINQLVPIQTTLKVDVPLRSWLPRINVTLPLAFNLPVHLVVPVKAQVPVDLDMLISGDLPPTLSIPLDATFAVRPHIKGELRAHMQSEAVFHLVAPLAPFEMSIAQAFLRVPFDLTFLKQRAP